MKEIVINLDNKTNKKESKDLDKYNKLNMKLNKSKTSLGKLSILFMWIGFILTLIGGMTCLQTLDKMQALSLHQRFDQEVAKVENAIGHISDNTYQHLNEKLDKYNRYEKLNHFSYIILILGVIYMLLAVLGLKTIRKHINNTKHANFYMSFIRGYHYILMFIFIIFDVLVIIGYIITGPHQDNDHHRYHHKHVFIPIIIFVVFNIIMFKQFKCCFSIPKKFYRRLKRYTKFIDKHCLKKNNINLNKKEVKEVKDNKTKKIMNKREVKDNKTKKIKKEIKKDKKQNNRSTSKNVDKITKIHSNSNEDLIEENTDTKNTNIKYPFYNIQHMSESIENNTGNDIKMQPNVNDNKLINNNNIDNKDQIYKWTRPLYMQDNMGNFRIVPNEIGINNINQAYKPDNFDNQNNMQMPPKFNNEDDN